MIRNDGFCFVRKNAVRWLGIKERRIELLCYEFDILIKMSNWGYFNTRQWRM